MNKRQSLPWQMLRKWIAPYKRMGLDYIKDKMVPSIIHLLALAIFKREREKKNLPILGGI